MNKAPRKTCPKCESSRWMTGLVMYPSVENEVGVSVSVWTGVLAFRTKLQAAMCADCGYTEFYATDPQTVWDEWSKQNR